MIPEERKDIIELLMRVPLILMVFTIFILLMATAVINIFVWLFNNKSFYNSFPMKTLETQVVNRFENFAKKYKF